MELAVIAGIGLLGYHLNNNDDNTSKEPKHKILSNDVPNGFDVYNQNRLSVSEEEQLNLAERSYEMSQYPEHTNIIPDYYNQIAPLLKKMPFDNRKRDKMALLYDTNKDLDDIYSDRGRKFVKKNYPNDIYKPNYVDRNSRLVSDLYEDTLKKEKPIIIPGVGRRHKRSTIDKNTSRPVGEPQRFVSGSDTYVVEGFSNLDNLDSTNDDTDLLSISESLTDNADSIKRIWSREGKQNIGLKGQPYMNPYKQTKTKRLIGVTPDYRKIRIDDEIGNYPEFFDKDDQQEVFSDEPTYAFQFEEQTYDNVGLPGAKNDIYKSNDKSHLSDLERQISYQGGWTPYTQNQGMSYGVVDDKEMIHDNMMPFFRKKYGYGSNDLHNVAAMDRKKELFTGNLTTDWRKKQEVKTLFNPVADMSYVYGTPIRSESEESRYIPGRYYQNELLSDPVRVTPGLNLNYDEVGTQGYFDMVRMMPKTVDELRTLNDQKTTYEGRIIEGQRGSARPVQAEVISYRPDGFKVTTEKDLLPTSDLNTGPKTRDNFIMKEQNRPDQQIEYTGGAFTDAGALNQIGPDNIRPMLKYSTKPTFTLPKPLQKFAKSETEFNPNLNSYSNNNTIRSQTLTEHFGNVVQSSRGGTNIQDIAKATIKETTLAPTQSHINGNTMRGTAIIMDIAKPTLKSITSENQLNPLAVGQNTMQRVYLSDVARPTMSELTLHSIEPSNINSGANEIYANWMDEQKITLKETTVEIPRNTYILPINQQQRAPDLQDRLRTTQKELTVEIPYQTMVVPVNQSQRAPDLQDKPKNTLKELTSQIQRDMFINTNQYQRAPDLQDRLRTTQKETTVTIPYNTMVTPVNQSQRAPDLQDRLRTTQKETTVTIPYNTMVTPVNQTQRAPDLQDRLRTTQKELTVTIPYNTMVTPVNQSQRTPDPQDKPRTTQKELTVTIPYNTMVTPVNQTVGAIKPQDHQKNTNRQFTTQEVYLQGPGGDEREKSYYADYNVVKDDRKEMLQIYYPPTTSNVDMGPDRERMNMYVKNDNNNINNVMMGVSVNNKMDRPISNTYVSAPKLNVPITHYVYPKMLSQLDSNPYNIPYYGNKYT